MSPLRSSDSAIRLAGAVLSVLKVSVEIGAGIDEDIMADQTAAAQAIARDAKREVRNAGARIAGSFNSGFPSHLQSNATDTWDSIAEHIREERNQDAADVLYGLGLPRSNSYAEVSMKIFEQLVDMYNSAAPDRSSGTSGDDAVDEEFDRDE